MHVIGTLSRLQIQRSSLKVGAKPDRRYDPGAILPVERACLGPAGVLGLDPAGGWIVDVHHQGHPETKNEDGLHGISVGFSTHYVAMRERFGNRITPGCAGENLLAESDRRYALEDLQGGVAIVDAAGAVLVRLKVVQVAHPCRPFTGWALGERVEPEVLKANLQFLDDGMRGFYCTAEGTGIVAVGDRLALL